ncbi:hypothetical protein [Acinetobacter johnsonii]|uniref:Uncharacterized protein n=1 Tax=Acinetobacter johnsonii TaxID=40214 RepID=A0A380TWW5_ACIJO|nr:hypothetical protein [Acinetobacter johnsonii]SUT93130.1 Uncharacterised protein [Acinetobacter johnsonii]
MGLAIFCLILGFIVGYLLRDSRQEKPKETIKKTRNVYLNYNERQREKIRYHNDADRIRQLNLLSPNESKFMRLLQHQFEDHQLIVKDRRFYIADRDNYPIAIFEYREALLHKDLKDNTLLI